MAGLVPAIHALLGRKERRGCPGQARALLPSLQMGYFDQLAMALVPAMIDHLLVPLACTRKQFSFDPFQVVQKPSCESFQVPSDLAPVLPSGSRVILPSWLNTILYLTFDSV